MDLDSCAMNGTDVYNGVTDKVMGVTTITIGMLGLVGNLLVFVAISLSKKLQTVTNVFVVSLAISDFLTALILPLHGLGILSGNEWPLESWVCKVVSFITVLSNPTSTLTLTAIAINRYILITKPRGFYLRIYSVNNVAWMLVFIWVFSFLLCVLPQLIPATGGLLYDPCFRTCIWDLQHKMIHLTEAAVAFVFLVCSCTIFFCYFSIYRYVRAHVTRTKRTLQATGNETHQTGIDIGTTTAEPKGPSLKEIRITQNMACVIVVFFICTVTYSFYLFTDAYSIVGAFLLVLLTFPVCLNPLIYAAKHPVFKEVFKSMFSCKINTIPEPTGCLKSNICNQCF